MSITPDQAPERKPRHQFQKGNTFGIKGRPKVVLTPEQIIERKAKNDLRAASKEFTGEALMTVVGIMRDPDVGAQQRLAAAGMILDRGHGKPRSNVDVDISVEYSNLSDAQLIRLITGKDISDEEVAAARGEPLVIEHDPEE